MIVKYLHERKEVDCSIYENSKPDTMTLEYYVLEEDGGCAARQEAAGFGARYGLMVVMNGSQAPLESRALRDVTPDAAEARRYARILAEHYVTPCGMLDVMEDLVAGAASL